MGTTLFAVAVAQLLISSVVAAIVTCLYFARLKKEGDQPDVDECVTWAALVPIVISVDRCYPRRVRPGRFDIPQSRPRLAF
jgi:hypothetical protein